MAQHDNGRRPVGQQAGPWQQGHHGQQDHQGNQQEQSTGGRYGPQSSGAQQGSHYGSHGQQDQYGQGRGQQGDNWREQHGSSSAGYRPGMEERSRGGQGGYGGQGSFGGQASDNDYGNRGMSESGNFGNQGAQRDSYGTMSGEARHGQGGSYDQGGQSSQRFGGQYRHGYDARTDSTGGYGSSNYGPDQNYGSGNYDRGYRGQDNDATYGQSSADRYQGAQQQGRGWQGSPGNQDRYGDNGYQGNWQQGQRGQSYHDPDYQQWRSEQMQRLDRDYDEWRQHRYQRFSEDFDNWRSNRDNNQPGQGIAQRGGVTSASQQSGQQAGDVSGQQGGTSKHDVSSGGDKGAGKTATK
jgi:hypothetical protein